MDQKTAKAEKAKQSGSVVIGIRLSEETAAAIKMEAGRRNIRLNRFIEELWEGYQQKQKGS